MYVPYALTMLDLATWWWYDASAASVGTLGRVLTALWTDISMCCGDSGATAAIGTKKHAPCLIGTARNGHLRVLR